jgi:MFS family permease
VSLFTGGAFFGAMFAGPSGDYLGRRLTILIGAAIFCVGGALQTGAPNIPALYMGRFFAGLGVGFLTMMIPIYQSELAHPSIRGRITALQQFMLGIGALVASVRTSAHCFQTSHSRLGLLSCTSFYPQLCPHSRRHSVCS